MSSETERLGSIRVVTDNDDGTARIGDLDGGFDENRLLLFLQREGERGFAAICEKLIYMGATARETWHAVRRAQQAGSLFAVAPAVDLYPKSECHDAD